MEKIISFFKKNYWQKLFWIGLLFFIVVLHAKNNLNSDEGAILDGAWNLFHHKRIYLDFFELTPPGSYYLIFWFWRIFGAHYFIAKLVAIFSLFLCALGIYQIGDILNETINPRKKHLYLYLSLLIFIFSTAYWPIISYHVLNLAATIWATYYFIRALKQPTVKNIIISGLLTGLAVLFMQNNGFVLLSTLALSLFIFFLKEKKYLWIKLLGLYLFATLLPLVLLIIKWPLRILYQDLIAFPLFNYTEVAKIPFYLLAFFLLSVGGAFWLLKKNLTKEIILLLCLQFFLLASTYSLADSLHISLVLFPLYALLPVLTEQVEKNKCKSYLYLIAAAEFAVIILPAITMLSTFPLFVTTQDYKFLNFVKQNCGNSPYIYAGPFLPGLYFETGKLNPTSFSWLITNHHTKEQFAKAAEQLADKKPACAILNYQMVAKYKYNQDNPVDNFIRQNYYQAYSEGDIIILRINN